MLKILHLTLICLLMAITSFGQVTDLGGPKSWTAKQTLASPDYHLLPSPDVQQLLQEDEINKKNGIKVFRFGYEHTVSHSLSNSGTWSTLPNGDRIWQIAYETKGALTMNIVFDDFHIPTGAHVYLYNPQTREYLGAYTHKNNNPDRLLGTSLVGGDNLVLEYYEPAAVKGQGTVTVGMVVHGYKSLSLHPASKNQKVLNSSGPCNVDVKCPLGIGWEDQINSVAIIIVGGNSACSGSLINNTTNDGTPYFLSANHCGTNGAGAWVFRFNWDSPIAICATNANSADPGAPYNDVNGAVLRANNAGSDFALFELNAAPTGNIYYSGWDRGTTPATQATGIHHPAGDVKKICRENDPLTTTTMGGAQVWEVNDWDQGVTEGGSSGSPLFNQNKLIIGQLYGGGAACSGTTDNGQSDGYGRLDISWNGTSAATRLSDWLDPANTGQTSIPGYNPNGPGASLDAGIMNVGGIEDVYCGVDSFTPEVTLRNFGTDTITSVQVVYNLDGGTNSTYNWSGTLLPNTTDLAVLPTITTTNGAHTFNVYTTMPNNSVDSNTVNDARSQNFLIVLNGEEVEYTLVTDCYGSEITWELRDSITNNVLYSGGPYSNTFNTIDTVRENFCVPPGCYTYTINDSYGDGLDGTSVNWCNRYGNYWIDDVVGNRLVAMTAVNGNFGSTASHTFCVPYIINSQTDLEALANQFRVYPNPTTGDVFINLALNEQLDYNLELYNATGQLLEAQNASNAGNQLHQFDMQSYATGMYFIKLRVGNKVLAKKVIKN